MSSDDVRLVEGMDWVLFEIRKDKELVIEPEDRINDRRIVGQSRPTLRRRANVPESSVYLTYSGNKGTQRARVQWTDGHIDLEGLDARLHEYLSTLRTTRWIYQGQEAALYKYPEDEAITRRSLNTLKSAAVDDPIAREIKAIIEELRSGKIDHLEQLCQTIGEQLAKLRTAAKKADETEAERDMHLEEVEARLRRLRKGLEDSVSPTAATQLLLEFIDSALARTDAYTNGRAQELGSVFARLVQPTELAERLLHRRAQLAGRLEEVTARLSELAEPHRLAEEQRSVQNALITAAPLEITFAANGYMLGKGGDFVAFAHQVTTKLAAAVDAYQQFMATDTETWARRQQVGELILERDRLTVELSFWDQLGPELTAMLATALDPVTQERLAAVWQNQQSVREDKVPELKVRKSRKPREKKVATPSEPPPPPEPAWLEQEGVEVTLKERLEKLSARGTFFLWVVLQRLATFAHTKQKGQSVRNIKHFEERFAQAGINVYSILDLLRQTSPGQELLALTDFVANRLGGSKADQELAARFAESCLKGLREEWELVVDGQPFATDKVDEQLVVGFEQACEAWHDLVKNWKKKKK